MKTETTPTYSSKEEAIEDLNAKGYKHIFEVRENQTIQSDDGLELPYEELEIDEIHTVKAQDQNELTSLYALSSKKGAKGVMIDGFGVTGSVHRTNFLQHLKSKKTIRR